MTRPLRVAFVQQRDARDVRHWSGTLHFSRRALERHLGEVVDLSPAPPALSLPFRAAHRLVRAATGLTYSPDHDPLQARLYGRYFGARVARARPDLVFSPAGSSCLAYLETDAPVVYFTDGPWSVARGYNPSFARVVERTARGADALERRALHRASLVAVSSRWAAEAVVGDYGVDPERVLEIGIGANLERPPAREEVLPRRLGGTIRLLLVGVSWEGKGGAIAHDALLSLLARGVDAELTVVGCTVPEAYRHPRLRNVPFLNKQVPEERARLEAIWRESDLFLLPTRSEAAGIVFCEASAYGLPSLATRTGGVPSLVADGRNGYTLPFEAGGEAYADRIAELCADPGRHARLCESSRDEYERRLSWDAWGETLARAVAERHPHLAARLPARPGAGAARA